MDSSTEKSRAQGSAAIKGEVSPWVPGECLCGIPNCAGHELIDGEISIINHPEIPDGDYAFTPPKGE